MEGLEEILLGNMLVAGVVGGEGFWVLRREVLADIEDGKEADEDDIVLYREGIGTGVLKFSANVKVDIRSIITAKRILWEAQSFIQKLS